jgi:hypothetical protein
MYTKEDESLAAGIYRILDRYELYNSHRVLWTGRLQKRDDYFLVLVPNKVISSSSFYDEDNPGGFIKGIKLFIGKSIEMKPCLYNHCFLRNDFTGAIEIEKCEYDNKYDGKMLVVTRTWITSEEDLRKKKEITIAVLLDHKKDDRESDDREVVELFESYSVYDI